jgi:regulator of sirC expression with transglutaminase-like and TPR domain
MSGDDDRGRAEGRAEGRLREIARLPDPRIDLAEAALWIAAEEQPGLDVRACLARLEELAEAARPVVEGPGGAHERALQLTRHFAIEVGFRGNSQDYYDLRNSYLNEVLDRRLGIPITLAIVWISLARRLGLDAQGVGFPGHFLAMVNVGEPDPPVYVDAFAGRVIDEHDCRRLLNDLTSGAEGFHPGMLAPVSSREILARVLRNLKQIHLHRSEPDSALRCSSRILLFQPDSASELRDRGLLNRALECFLASEADLSRYLELYPEAHDADSVGRILEQIRGRTSRLN